MHELYSCESVAERYGVRIRTVWGWIRKGKLSAIKIGKQYRVTSEDLRKFEESNRGNGA